MDNVTIAHIGHLFKELHSKISGRKKKGWGFIPSFSCTSPPPKPLSFFVTKVVSLAHSLSKTGKG